MNSQADVVKSINVTRSRVNQYLRLLRLPEVVKERIRRGEEKAGERGLRRFLEIGDHPMNEAAEQSL